MSEEETAPIMSNSENHQEPHAWTEEVFTERLAKTVGSGVEHPEDRKDIIQEARTRAFEHYHTSSELSRQQATFTIARRLVVDYYRKRARHPQLSLEVLAESGREFTTAASEEEEVMYEKRVLREALATLSPQQERCILFWAAGLTYDEIAGRLRVQRSTVHSHLKVAKRLLRAYGEDERRR